MRERTELKPAGHVVIVGKNDVYWNINFDSNKKARIQVASEPMLWKKFAAFAAQASATGEIQGRNMESIKPDPAWIIKVRDHVNQAILKIAMSGMFSIAKLLLNIETIYTEQLPTLAISWDKVTKVLRLLINPVFLYQVVATDRSSMPESDIIAYILAHESLHVLRGHVGREAIYGGRFDNEVEDLAINYEVSRMLQHGDKEVAVDGGLINPMIFLGELNVKNAADLASMSKLITEAYGAGVPSNPVMVKIDTQSSNQIPHNSRGRRGRSTYYSTERVDIDPTAILSMLNDMKTGLTVKGRVDDLTSKTIEATASETDGTPKPQSLGMELAPGMLVTIKKGREYGVIVSVEPAIKTGPDVDQKITVVKLANMPDEIQKRILGMFRGQTVAII